LLLIDDVTVNEVLKFLPGIETVITKWAIDRTSARCLSLQKTGELIQAAAARAVERRGRGEFQSWTFEPPLTLEIVCAHHGLATKLASVPGAVRTSVREIAFHTDSYFELYEALLNFVYLALLSNDPSFE
jgi:D-amino peptidase